MLPAGFSADETPHAVPMVLGPAIIDGSAHTERQSALPRLIVGTLAELRDEQFGVHGRPFVPCAGASQKPNTRARLGRRIHNIPPREA